MPSVEPHIWGHSIAKRTGSGVLAHDSTREGLDLGDA